MQGHGQTTRQDGEKQSGGPDLDGAGLRKGTPDGAEVYAPDDTSCQAGGAARTAAAGRPRWLSRLERWLLPCACQLCGAVQDDVVCAGCAADVMPAACRCGRCAAPLAGPVSRAFPNSPIPPVPRTGGTCGSCRLAPPPFDASLALGDYAAPQDRLVLALKFGAALPLAHWFAAALAARWRDSGRPAPHLIVPVPLAAGRLAERGFNQAWEIARRLGRQLGVPARADLLVRGRETAAQSTLDIAARHLNMAGAFALAPGASVKGLHIGVVDDVMTTGATLSDAAAVLKRHGAARITAIVALRTP